MVSVKVYDLCTSKISITTELAKSPREAPGDIAQRLYNTDHLHVVDTPAPKNRKRASKEELQRALQCGQFGGTRPSELFLQAFHDLLGTLDTDPLSSCVSPPLVGTTGVVPFAIIGPLMDIARHMSNMIVRARHEILLATNYWIYSGASQLITDALAELSRRAGQRGEMVAVRIMYDRGTAKQLLDNHQIVSEEDRTSASVRLPPAQDVPHIDLQVVNFHRPLLGTFHSKFMIIDRDVAIVQSNNLQDNDNVEMMTQVEGAVVDSLREVFHVSWHTSIGPLPCARKTAGPDSFPTFQEPSFTRLFDSQGVFTLGQSQSKDSNLPEHVAGDPHYDIDVAGEIERTLAILLPHTRTETCADIVARHLNQTLKLSLRPAAPDLTSHASDFFPFVPLAPHKPVPIAIVARKPFGSPNHTSLYVPQNMAFLSLIQNATRSVFMQTPDLNASPLYEAILAAVRRGIQVTYYVCLGYNDAGELLPGQNGTNEMFANSLYVALEKDPGPNGVKQAKRHLQVYYYVAKDQVVPIHNKFTQRSCQVKLMIVDDCVAIQGSGNQDTQSWWQSQEVNIMVDSPLICRSWREGIDRNQNTGVFPPPSSASADSQASSAIATTPASTKAASKDKPTPKAYGRADDDGCWRDAHGKLAEGSLRTGPGTFAWAKGMVGAYKRAKGQGGF